MGGLYCYPTADIDESFNFWTVFNPATTADTTEMLSATAYEVPHDWNAEFSLNFVPVPEMEQKFVTAAPI